MILLQFLPLYITILAANLAPSGRVWRWITVALLVAIDALLFIVGVSFLVAGVAPVTELAGPEGAGLPLSETRAVIAATLLMLTSVFALLLFHPAVRAAVIRTLRFEMDPGNTVHLVALVLALWLVGATLAQVFILGGLPITEVVGGISLSLALLWEQGIAFVLFALLGVGLGLRRGFNETMERLGLVMPTLRQLAIVLVAIFLLTIWDLLLSIVWQAAAPESFERISEISELLFEGVVGPLGALTIGLSAGIGEEVLFRGAIQPRFGLLAATVLFTVGHTQYEFSPALFSVFVIGLVLGVIRRRENTTTAILIHAGYNALNVLLAPLW